VLKVSKLLKRIKERENNRIFWQILSTCTAIIILFTLYNLGIVSFLYINHQPVSLGEFVLFVKREGPDNAIDRLITEKIIEIEAKRRNIYVTQQEISEELSNYHQKALESSVVFSDIIINSAQTSKDVEKNIKLRIMLYKILSQDIEVTEWEVDQYFKENRELFKGKEEDEIKREIKRILINEKVTQKYESWIKEAKASAEVNYIIDY
jgi:hypothetical protein